MSRRTFAFDWINPYLLDRGVYRPTEIANLEHIEAVEDVFGLDVPMDHTVAVQVPDPTRHLPEIVAGQVFLEVVLRSDFSK